MQNFAAALKDEIRRLARKEIRAQLRDDNRADPCHRHIHRRLLPQTQGYDGR